MWTHALTDEDEEADVATEETKAEYVFDGFTVEFNDKIVLTPIETNQTPSSVAATPQYSPR